MLVGLREPQSSSHSVNSCRVCGGTDMTGFVDVHDDNELRDTLTLRVAYIARLLPGVASRLSKTYCIKLRKCNIT